MEPPCFSASAPGSFMLLGEHAVLHGHPALVAAADRRMKVAVKPRLDRRVSVRSALGVLDTDLDHLTPRAPFTFVLEALRREVGQLPGGLDIEIEAGFSHTVGLGSSAAVTVALLASLRQWRGRDVDPRELIGSARAVIRGVQGSGSGADAAASVLGGVSLYRADPLELETVKSSHPLALVYAGYKTPTPAVIRIVEDQARQDPERYARLYTQIGSLPRQGLDALRAGDLAAFARILRQGQALMVELGVCDARLAEIVAALERQPGVLAAKISGSGLGDCVLAWGVVPEAAAVPGELIPVAISTQGVVSEP